MQSVMAETKGGGAAEYLGRCSASYNYTVGAPGTATWSAGIGGCSVIIVGEYY